MNRYTPEFFTQNKREPMTINFIRQAINDRAILEGRVASCDEKLNLYVNLGDNIVAVIPFDEFEYTDGKKEIKPTTVMAKVNKHIKFIPLSVEKTNENSGYVVHCSRKECQKECIEEYVSKLKPGDVIDARALKVVNYGIFCDIGCGVVSLLPTSNISVTHVIKPEELLAGITKMKVIIKDNSDPFRVQLSHRELLGTWEQEISKFKEGDLVAGLVLSVEDYGIFVRLSQNLSGLAEPTELNIKPGDLVSVQILCIKPEAMKTRLNITERIEIADPKELEEAKKMKFNYYITSGNIDKWVYSVDGSRRTIETVFHN